MNGREPVNPIVVARRFEQQYRLPGSNSYTTVAERFGVTRPVVCYYLSLLYRLPADFVQWLESSADLRAVTFFSERRLRPVTRIADPDAQHRRLQELVAEYHEQGVAQPDRRPTGVEC